MASVSTPSDDSDFQDLGILAFDDQNTSVFDDSDIDLLRLKKCFPENVVFHVYNPLLKADHASETWVCFPEYPFTLGLHYPFPDLIMDFFKLTGLCFPQLMPMAWRLLYTIDRLNQNLGFNIGLPELSLVYQLRTHGHSRFVLQRRSDRVALVPNITMNENEWRNKFFFVKRSSIPGGSLLPVSWVRKAQKFESLIAPQEDSEKAIEELLEIDEDNRRFGCVPIVASESHSLGHSKTDMSSDNLFVLEDLSSLMTIKKEKASPSAPKPRPVTRAAKGKKRKPTETIDIEDNIEGADKIHEGLQMLIDDRKVMHSELVETKALQKTAYDRCAILDKENLSLKKQIKDLTASSSRKIQETVDAAKRSAVMAILQAKIQMATEAGDKGLELWKESLESWTAILDKMKGEKAAASVGVEASAQGDGDTGTSKDAGGDQREEEVVEARFAGDDGCHA